jgi:hypothetical protein
MKRAALKRAEVAQAVLADPAIDRLAGILELAGYTLAPVRLPRTLRQGPVRVHLVFRQVVGPNVATLRYQRIVSVS